MPAQPGSSLIGPVNILQPIKMYPLLDRSTSLLNIVIHMLFASTDRLSVQRELEVKTTLWCQQEKSSNEYLNIFLVNCRLSLTYIHLDAHNRFYLFSLASPRCTKANPNIVVRRLVSWPQDEIVTPCRGTTRSVRVRIGKRNLF